MKLNFLLRDLVKSGAFYRISLLSASLLLISAGETYALPFKQTPASYQAWYNTIQWTDGLTRVFENFGQCTFSPRGGMGGRDFVVCDTGYETTVSPMGTKVCRINNIAYRKEITANAKPRMSYGTIGECRWR